MKKHLFGPGMPLFKIPVQLTYMTCKWVKVTNKDLFLYVHKPVWLTLALKKWKQRGNDSTHEEMTAMFTDSVNSKLHKARLSVRKIIKSDFTDSGFATASLHTSGLMLWYEIATVYNSHPKSEDKYNNSSTFNISETFICD